MSAGQVRAGRAVSRAREDGERDAVFRAGMGVEEDRDEDDRVAEEDREQRLLPVHPAVHEARGQHVRRDAVRHRDPQRRVVVGRPGAPGDGDGREIFVIKSAPEDGGCVRQLDTPVGVDDLPGVSVHEVRESYRSGPFPGSPSSANRPILTAQRHRRRPHERRPLGRLHRHSIREPVPARVGAAHGVRNEHHAGLRGRLGRRRHEDDRPASRSSTSRARRRSSSGPTSTRHASR